MKLLEWFRDGAVRKVARFGVPVALGKLLASLASLATLALLARHLGPVLFGVVAVIRTVVSMVDQYANCNTWQAIIKYGAEALAANRRQDVERIIKLGVLIDLATGVISVLVLMGLALVIPATFGLSSHEAWLGALYGATLVTRVAGASDGIFRLSDAYRAQAITSSLSGLIGTGAVAIAVGLDASIDGCVLALVIGEVIGNILVTVASFYVARDQGWGGWPRVSLVGIRATFPGLVRFLLSTNAQLTVKKTHGELDMLVVASMLGKAPAGLFRVVKQLGTIPGRVFLPFEQVLFTELARSAASGDFVAFRRLLRRFAGIAVAGSLAIWAVTALAAEPLIRIVAGEDYLGAVPAFRWYMLAMVILVANAPIQRALIALGRPGTLFLFDLATLGVLIAAAIAGAYYWGLVGVAAAVVAHKAVQFAWSTWLVRRVAIERQAAHDSAATAAG